MLFSTVKILKINFKSLVSIENCAQILLQVNKIELSPTIFEKIDEKIKNLTINFQ